MAARRARQQVIATGFRCLRRTRLHKLAASWTGGSGAIVMLHHVRQEEPRGFAPNALLKITPDFLDGALTRIAALGFDLVSMDEALRRMAAPRARRFVALTFDDGYRDLADVALPILERHRAPFCAYVTTGFAERTARLWWVELENAIRALARIDLSVEGEHVTFEAGNDEAKARAFEALYWRLRAGPEDQLLDTIGHLAHRAGLDGRTLVAERCLDWEGVRNLARHPLCTIGAHTLTHPMLAKHPHDRVRAELEAGRARLETEIGLPVRHLAYPVGDPGSAGAREYALAGALGYSSAVTTRPGMIFPAQAGHPMSLPRLSLNGRWQDLDVLEILLSGLPFALWNRGRRIAA